MARRGRSTSVQHAALGMQAASPGPQAQALPSLHQIPPRWPAAHEKGTPVPTHKHPACLLHPPLRCSSGPPPPPPPPPSPPSFTCLRLLLHHAAARKGGVHGGARGQVQHGDDQAHPLCALYLPYRAGGCRD